MGIVINMRNKLIKLLRELEKESGFKNEHSEFEEAYGCNYLIEEYLDFPDYRFVTTRFNDEHAIKKDDVISLIPSNSILAEMKRMEADGLVMIGVQKCRKYATAIGNGPDFNEGDGISFTTESVVLTTQGKSAWLYFLHTILENPLANALSAIAVIVSIIALFT